MGKLRLRDHTSSARPERVPGEPGRNAGVSAQNKATYPWPPAERRRGGNPGEGRPRFRERDSPDQGPLQFFVVQRPVTRGRPLQWPSTGSPCLSEAGVQGPPPSTSKHTTGKYLPVQPFLCGHTGPRTARPKCLTTQAAGQGWMGPGRPSGQLLSHTHTHTHSHTSVGGRGCRTSPAGLGFPPSLGCRPKPPKWPSRPGKRVHTYLGGRTLRFKLGLLVLSKGGLSTQGVPAAAPSPAKNLFESYTLGAFSVLPLLQTFQGWVGKKAASLRAV